MSRYDDFLRQLKKDHNTTAQMAIKRLYLLLKEDDPNLSKDDMYDRILKDCLVIWARATIIANMPDELKDRERQESGKKGAAEKKKQQLSVTHNGNVASEDPAKSSSVEQKEQESKSVVQASTNRNDTSSFIIDRDADDDQSNDNLSPFEFPLPAQDVLGYIIPIFRLFKKGDKERQIWFSGILDKRTIEVISAAIGRRRTPSEQGTAVEREP